MRFPESDGCHMIVGLNLLHANIEIGGVWDYIKGILTTLGEYDHRNEYICYCTPESECLVPLQSNFSKKIIGFSNKNRLKRILYENTMLAIQSKRDKIDCLHWFANTLGFFCSAPSVVSIYDVLIYESSTDFSLAKRAYLKYMLPRTVKSASVLAPMSQSTATSVARILGANPTSMVVIPPVISEAFKPASAESKMEFRTKYGLPREFWLYVAHFYPHKNHERLFQAYARLKSTGVNRWPLVLRGDRKGADDHIIKLLNENEIKDDVIWLPRLRDEEMPLLFSVASALVFTSMYEGGGMPVMEAMACGCPVTASRIPTNLEFSGDAALLFDPLDVESITDAMHQFAKNPKLREKHQQLGLERVQYLRPHNIYKLVNLAYQKARASLQG
jgi:glycosyltransferase involved in cell wall biosynthesis